MLVLTRKRGETIFIGEDIRIVLIEIQQHQAKIGIACPDALSVMRAELGPRTKKGKWPNCSPDEIFCLQQRLKDLAEWWTFPMANERRREAMNLCEFLDQLRHWTFDEYLERYSHWYKENDTLEA
jgi:carbon storage regulator CsrA